MPPHAGHRDPAWMHCIEGVGWERGTPPEQGIQQHLGGKRIADETAGAVSGGHPQARLQRRRWKLGSRAFAGIQRDRDRIRVIDGAHKRQPSRRDSAPGDPAFRGLVRRFKISGRIGYGRLELGPQPPSIFCASSGGVIPMVGGAEQMASTTLRKQVDRATQARSDTDAALRVETQAGPEPDGDRAPEPGYGRRSCWPTPPCRRAPPTRASTRASGASRGCGCAPGCRHGPAACDTTRRAAPSPRW